MVITGVYCKIKNICFWRSSILKNGVLSELVMKVNVSVQKCNAMNDGVLLKLKRVFSSEWKALYMFPRSFGQTFFFAFMFVLSIPVHDSLRRTLTRTIWARFVMVAVRRYRADLVSSRITGWIRGFCTVRRPPLG